MNTAPYSEMAYFPDREGRRNHCQHCAARDEHIRLNWLAKRTQAAIRSDLNAHVRNAA